uniref:SPK domain-containing protein n=1 Tax=Caenorhabditis tropicalis TaxID=1561998 RepID=A0A1I7TZM5_9PELO
MKTFCIPLNKLSSSTQSSPSSSSSLKSSFHTRLFELSVDRHANRGHKKANVSVSTLRLILESFQIGRDSTVRLFKIRRKKRIRVECKGFVIPSMVP